MGETERLDLIEAIWDSLPEEVQEDSIPDWHREILAERRALAENRPVVGRPWREVLGDE